MAHKPLTALQVKSAPPGRHRDAHGLYLVVKPSGARSWVLRVQADGQRRDFGLGPADLVSLTDARAKAIKGRQIMREGGDPSKEWKRKKSDVPNFEQAARKYMAVIKDGWSNEKHREQWLSSLERHAFPAIGDHLVDAIGSPEILKALRPIWMEIPETARRVRQRIGKVLDFSFAEGWRAIEAPMGTVNMGLGKQPPRDGHFAAMPFKQLPDFITALRRQEVSVGRLALEFTILTAARSGETRGATWDEIDWSTKLWSIPATRMGKTNKPHTVPLSDAALAVLEKAKVFSSGPKSVIFPGAGGKSLSDMTLGKALKSIAGPSVTTHGMRSAFRDWCAEEQPNVPGEAAERALSHTIRNKVEKAYHRTDYLEIRTKLMQAWADFLR